MEKKFQQAIREKDQLQKQLDVRTKHLILIYYQNIILKVAN